MTLRQGAWHWLTRVLVGLFLLLMAWECWIFAQVLWWKSHNPERTSFMKIRAEARLAAGKGDILPHPWVPYEKIPDGLKRAVVAAEDSGFTTHHGFDWEGMKKAFEKDVRHGRAVAGGSTITQQLAKNLFLSGHRSLWRKGQEAIITLMLESTWSKRRILEVYLNEIEWGDGIFGCAAASRHYYQVSVTELSPTQSARLASMIPSPRYFDRHRETDRLLEKTDTIEARMQQVAIPR
jgi:monofunctional biosynthetic peptidoglycan transglycosylase